MNVNPQRLAWIKRGLALGMLVAVYKISIEGILLADALSRDILKMRRGGPSASPLVEILYSPTFMTGLLSLELVVFLLLSLRPPSTHDTDTPRWRHMQRYLVALVLAIPMLLFLHMNPSNDFYQEFITIEYAYSAFLLFWGFRFASAIAHSTGNDRLAGQLLIARILAIAIIIAGFVFTGWPLLRKYPDTNLNAVVFSQSCQMIANLLAIIFFLRVFGHVRGIISRGCALSL